MWRAQVGDSELIILGSVTPIHHQQKWDQRRVVRALTGARLLLTPVDAKVGVGGVASFLGRDAFRVRTLRGDLEKDMPPDLRARFIDLRQQAKVKADRYAKWKPAVAGGLLLSDFRQARAVPKPSRPTRSRISPRRRACRSRPWPSCPSAPFSRRRAISTTSSR